jgi:hypothetical protein
MHKSFSKKKKTFFSCESCVVSSLVVWLVFWWDSSCEVAQSAWRSASLVWEMDGSSAYAVLGWVSWSESQCHALVDGNCTSRIHDRQHCCPRPHRNYNPKRPSLMFDPALHYKLARGRNSKNWARNTSRKIGRRHNNDRTCDRRCQSLGKNNLVGCKY